MIIDVHTHLGRMGNEHVRVKDLLKSMDEAKIDQALVFAGSINGCPTDEMLKEIKPYRDRLYGVIAVELGNYMASFSPGSLFEKFNDQLNTPNVVAAKFYLGYEHFYPSDNLISNFMRVITRSDKTAIFHTGDCYNCIKGAKLKYAHPLGIDDVATDFLDTRIVMAHMGYPWTRDAAQVCYKNKNVFVDISGFVYGKFDDMSKSNFMDMYTEFLKFNDNDSDRILFGTDWPISDQVSYVQFISKHFAIEKFTDNAIRAFKL